MNKLLTKIVGVALGATMAVGVGVAAVKASDGGMQRAEAAEGTVTFTSDNSGNWNASAGAQSGTVDGITLACSNGINNGTQLRFYASSTITLSSNVGNITNVVFTASQGTITQASSGTYDGLTWTGSTDSFTLKVGTQIRATEVAITYSSGVTPDPDPQTASYDYTFTSSKFSSSSLTATLAAGDYQPSWTVSTDAGYFGYEAARGQQLGSKNDPCSTATLSTSSFTDAIKKVTVYTAGYTGGSVSVSVGGQSLGNSQSYSSTNEAYTFNKTGTSQFTGALVISWTNTARALYLKEIYVEFEEAETVHVTSIELGNDISLSKGLSQTIVPVITPANATNQNVTYVSSDTSIAEVDNTGKVTAVGIGSTTITGTSVDNNSATDSITVTVTAAIPSSLSWSKQNKYFAEGETLGSYFTENMNVLAVVYSDSTRVTKALGDSGLTMTLGGETVDSTRTMSISDDGKVLKATFVEGSISVSQQITLQVSPLLSIESITKNFTGGKSYILSSDTNSTLTVSYTSLNGQPSVTAVSSDENILLAEADSLTYDPETKAGTFNVTLVPDAVGTVYINITLTCGEKSLSKATESIVIRSADPVTTDDKYTKVTSLSEITTDDSYLIVSENFNKALDGSLANPDSTPNTISITFDGDDINSNATTRAAEFTIDKTNGYLLASCGLYIYGENGSNKLRYTDDPSLGVLNSFSFDENDNFIAVSYTSTLCWNNAAAGSGGQKFRYAKSTSTISDTGTGWYHIQLYKFVEGESGTDDESKVLTFINNYMHPEINADDKGTGLCTANGWYTAAKSHVSTDLSDTQRLLFKNNYSNYYLRLQAWAAANGEIFEIGNTGAIQSAAINPINKANNTVAIVVVVTISLVSVSALGAYFLLRKKKEER